MVENRWSFGRQLYWGLIFFLGFVFLSLFFFDESERFKNLFELSLGLLAVLVACYSKRGLKILKHRPSFGRQTRWLQWLGLGCLLYMMLVGHVFSSIYALFFPCIEQIFKVLFMFCLYFTLISAISDFIYFNCISNAGTL